MKLSTKLIVSLIGVLFLSLSGFLYWANTEVRKTYSALLEENLKNDAAFVAALVSKSGSLENLDLLFGKTIKGKGIDFYITDETGKVVFNSADKSLIGEDYSQWNDVYLTLRKKYGARSTRTNKEDPLSSIYYIAAPIRIDGELKGVASVFRPELSLNHILERSKTKILLFMFSILMLVIIFISIIFQNITKPFENLKQYIAEILIKRNVKIPELPEGEFRELAKSIKGMKESLDEKNKIEAYVQKLTHELKSPLTAINASAEILEDEDDIEIRKKFTENIQQQSLRIKEMLNTLLEISRVQKMESVEKSEKIPLSKLVKDEVENLEALFKTREDIVKVSGEAELIGDEFLMRIAVRNILQNIVSHAQLNSQIEIEIKSVEDEIILKISNTKSHVPEFVLEGMFEKYFSYSGQRDKSRSSGLGLSLVKEIIDLHKGRIQASQSSDKFQISINIPVISGT